MQRFRSIAATLVLILGTLGLWVLVAHAEALLR